MTATPSLVETDVSRLDRLVHLEYPPESAQWQTLQQSEVGSGLGPDDWALVAVLRYDEASMVALRTKTAEVEPMGRLVVEPDFIRDWFPEPIRQAFVPDGDGSRLTLAIPRYPATSFAKAPLTSGYFFLTEEGFLFLYLFTT